MRTADETGAPIVAGQAESAPVNFRPGKLALRATIIASVFTALFVANYRYGWITVADIDVLPKTAERRRKLARSVCRIRNNAL